MDPKIFKRIQEGAQQAADFASGKDTSKVTVRQVVVGKEAKVGETKC